MKVVVKPTTFGVSNPLRRIGVSAFGYGGTNAHAILESTQSVISGYSAHKPMRRADTSSDRLCCDRIEADRPHLLLFSAHDEVTLKNNITDYSKKCKASDLIDLQYTLGLRRTKLSKRAFAIARRATLESDIQAAIVSDYSPGKDMTLAFVFTGMVQRCYLTLIFDPLLLIIIMD